LKYGLAHSMNTVTAWVMKTYGPEAVIKLARDMGITSDLPPVPSLCLGTADLSLYELVGANATFANKGLWIEPSIIIRIEDKNGNTIYDVAPKAKEAMDENTAFSMLELMKGVVDYGSGNRLRRDYKYGNIKHPIAGKTGTTQSNSDGWFVGITPDLVSGVWVGGEDRSIRFSKNSLGQGAVMALPIWGYYMKSIYADTSIKISKGDFERPAGLVGSITDCEDHKSNIDQNFKDESENW
jgi:penicillin-binding protein 1A